MVGLGGAKTFQAQNISKLRAWQGGKRTEEEEGDYENSVGPKRYVRKRNVKKLER